MNSWIYLLDRMENFFTEHKQVKKFMGEFREQMPNFSTKDQKYPLIFVVPVNKRYTQYEHYYTIQVYCVDLIQEDRSNINTIVSDTALILDDFYIALKFSDEYYDLDVITEPDAQPVNNFDLDYVAGWFMNIEIGVRPHGLCAIPTNEEL